MSLRHEHKHVISYTDRCLLRSRLSAVMKRVRNAVADGTYKLPEGTEPSMMIGLFFAIATAIGFALALVIFAGMREQLAMAKVPKAMQGTPIALLTAGLLAMAFMGFSGVV